KGAQDELRAGGDLDRLAEGLGKLLDSLALALLVEHMFNRFIEIKRREWEDYRVQVTHWELDRYLSVL
ncbi:MAG: glutamine synthetase, partial [Solirubrobacterales bacterium]